MGKINRIRSIIERFTQRSKDPQEDIQNYLAKCTRLFELLTMLNELEELGEPEENSVTYDDDLVILNQQVDSIGEEVRKIIWH